MIQLMGDVLRLTVSTEPTPSVKPPGMLYSSKLVCSDRLKRKDGLPNAKCDKAVPAVAVYGDPRPNLRIKLAEAYGNGIAILCENISKSRAIFKNGVNIPSNRCQALVLVHPDPRMPTLVLYHELAMVQGNSQGLARTW
jgi:hypothetical protein